MINKYITDTFFIPSEYYKVEAYQDMYQIAYSALYRRPDFDRVLNTIVYLAKQTTSQLALKSKIVHWSIELDRIIKKLKNCQKDKLHAEVLVPFTFYDESIEITISQYEFAKIVINQLVNDPSMIANEKTEEAYSPIPSLYSLFADYILDFQESFEGTEGLRECYSVIFDELFRRGLKDADRLFECDGMKILTGLPPFSPSKNCFSNVNTFIELYIKKKCIFNEKDSKQLVNDDNKEEIGEDIKEGNNKKVRCGVLYYLLNNLLDDYTLSAIINYCCNTPYNKVIKKKNTNSVDKYLRLYKKRDISPDKFDSFELKPDVIDAIKGILREYELEIPKKLQDK